MNYFTKVSFGFFYVLISFISGWLLGNGYAIIDPPKDILMLLPFIFNCIGALITFICLVVSWAQELK